MSEPEWGRSLEPTEAAHRLRLVIELGRQVASRFDPEHLLPAACQQIAEAFGYDIVGVNLVDPLDGNTLYPAAAYPPEQRLPRWFRVPVGKGLTGWVAAHGEPRLANDVATEPLYIPGPGRRTRSELDVPLRAGDRVIGVLNVESERVGAFRPDDVPFLEAVGILLAQSITGARVAAAAREAAAAQERARVARELHDDTIQALVAIARQLDLLEMDLNAGRAPSQRLEGLRGLVERTLDGARRLSANLRPAVLEDLGLVPALRSLADEMTALGLKVEVAVAGHPHRLRPAVEHALYRIAQEALANTLRHAEVAEAELEISFTPQEVRLSVLDHGAGFDPQVALAERSHLGLRGMQDRAAEIGAAMEIASRPGLGTRISVAVPAKLTLVDRL